MTMATLSILRRAALAIGLLLCATHGANSALAQDARASVAAGNAHFEAGRYAEALEAYDQVNEDTDQSIAPELLHNRAAAHFNLGDLDDARELWVRAASLRDEAFEANARYNLGNCDYAEALRCLEANSIPAALEALARAQEQYRDALRLNPQLANARANLELAAQLKQQIEEMAEQQPQSQPSPAQEEQEQCDQGSDNQSSSQPSQSTQPSQQQEQDPNSTQPQDQQPEDRPAEPEPPSSQPQPPAESQPAPQPQPSDETQEQGEDEQELTPVDLSRKEAERLLQMIRDAEKQRRAILRQREAARHRGRPVEKDW